MSYLIRQNKKTIPNKKQALYYIDNETFYKDLTEWKKSGKEEIPNCIAKAILQICRNLAKSGKFVGYTWKEEMIEDAIFSCIKFCRNFNPEKSTNAFAYFTMIAWHAFLYRIKVEKEKINTLLEYRDELDQLYDLSEYAEDSDGVDSDGYGYIEDTAKRINTIFRKEQSQQKNKNKKNNSKKKEKKKPSVEDFF